MLQNPLSIQANYPVFIEPSPRGQYYIQDEHKVTQQIPDSVPPRYFARFECKDIRDRNRQKSNADQMNKRPKNSQRIRRVDYWEIVIQKENHAPNLHSDHC